MTTSQMAPKAAEAPVVHFKNGLFLAGEILSLTDTGFILQTVNRVPVRGSDEIKEYPEQNPIVIDPAIVAAKGFDIGARVQFYGLIQAQADSKIRRIHAFPATLVKAAGPADANVCEMAGIIGTTTYTPSDPILRKQGFGRSFVGTNAERTRSVPIVMFQQMGAIWEKVPAGSEVIIGGRVRSQVRGGYVDAQGDINLFTEVVADPTKSRVVKRAIVVNTLSGVDFAAMEASAFGATPAEAPAQPEVQAPAKAKKGKAALDKAAF